METDRAKWQQLEEVLRRQIRLMEEFAELQVETRHCLERRDWPQLELVQGQMLERAREIEMVEEERAALWEECCRLAHADSTDSFYAIILRLPEDQRSRLSELRQTLRISALNVEGASRALSEYVSVSSSLIQGYLREVCTDLKTGVYGPGGKLRTESRFSMVLDTHI